MERIKKVEVCFNKLGMQISGFITIRLCEAEQGNYILLLGTKELPTYDIASFIHLAVFTTLLLTRLAHTFWQASFQLKWTHLGKRVKEGKEF